MSGQVIDEQVEKAFEMYDKGDFLGAEKIFLSVADRDSTAMFCLGEIYWNNEVPGDNAERALYWYAKAAECGNGLAQLWLGNNYCIGIRSMPDPEKAFYWYSKAAAQNMALAQYHLGICYSTGWGCEANEDKALECMKASATNNFFPADLFLLDNYRRNGVSDYRIKRNEFEAKYEIKIAEDEKSFWEYIAFLMSEEKQYEVDGERAFELLNSCSSKDADSRLWYLACCYERGIGTEKDVKKAVDLLKLISKSDKRVKSKLMLLEAGDD